MSSLAEDVRETPRAFFDKQNERFRFTLDAAANHQNALCAKYYTEHGLFRKIDASPVCLQANADGLSGSWSGERVFCNPPYSEIEGWVFKAWSSETELVYMLLPAVRTEQAWWHRLVEPFRDYRDGRAEVTMTLRTEFIRERLRFTVDGGKPILSKSGAVGSPRFGCVGLIWRKAQ